MNIAFYCRQIANSHQPPDDPLRNVFNHRQRIHPCIEARLILDYVPHARQHLLVHQDVRHNPLFIFGLQDLLKGSSRVKLSPADVQTDHCLPSDNDDVYVEE